MLIVIIGKNYQLKLDMKLVYQYNTFIQKKLFTFVFSLVPQLLSNSVQAVSDSVQAVDDSVQPASSYTAVHVATSTIIENAFCFIFGFLH